MATGYEKKEKMTRIVVMMMTLNQPVCSSTDIFLL